MAVTPAVFFKFGRKAAEEYVAREEVDPLDAVEAVPAKAARRLNSDGNGELALTGTDRNHGDS